MRDITGPEATMAESGLLTKGREIRRQLLGDAYVERVAQTTYAHR